ncbi:MAG TPA: carboxyl transferase domain-containing protein [Streptosporangiaceae bacterium]|nr:carboxyl transferase domain-containing protein [Streptosporangiaceae bacterium]
MSCARLCSAACGLMAADPGRPAPLHEDVADPGSLSPFGDEIEPGNPSGWPGYPGQIERTRKATGTRHAVTTGFATAGGEPCVLIGFDFAFLGGSMGSAEGARIARAFSVAITQRLPVVAVAASGGSRMQEGTSALVQMQAVAAAVATARRAGIPHVGVAGDPTTGGVWSSLIAGADVLIGVPGARVSFSGSRTRPAGADPRSGGYLAEGLWEHGLLDVLSPAHRLRAEVGAALRLLSPRTRGKAAQPAPLPAWPDSDSAEPRGSGDAWAQVSGARNAARDRADRWLAGYFGQTFEIHGDRCGGLDSGLRCGFGSHRGATIAYVAQTGQRTTPAGFRTATRLITLASRLALPVLTLIDTPGAAAGPRDEAAGLGAAIAELFVTVAASQVPIRSVVIGEGVSGGALALASRADLWIARDAYLAVTAPELAASILKRPGCEVPELATWLRLTPGDLLSRGIVRGIIGPPAASAG